MGFFKSFFSGKQEKPETEKQKNDQKNFEIFKYDGPIPLPTRLLLLTENK